MPTGEETLYNALLALAQESDISSAFPSPIQSWIELVHYNLFVYYKPSITDEGLFVWRLPDIFVWLWCLISHFAFHESGLMQQVLLYSKQPTIKFLWQCPNMVTDNVYQITCLEQLGLTFYKNIASKLVTLFTLYECQLQHKW